MPSEVILPRVDMDMASGKISRWLVGDGTRVKKGQPLFEIETDKAAMEIEAEASGTLHTLTEAGADDVKVGSVVAWIYGEGEAAAAPQARHPASVAEAPIRAATPERGPASRGPEPEPEVVAAGERRRATPLARRLARERGLDLADLAGSGPRGRVQAADVPNAGLAGSAGASVSAGPDAGRARIEIAATPGSAGPRGADVPSAAVAATAAGALMTLRDGEGPPVVLVHGFGSDANGWRPFLAGYDGARPVLALDLPGHGAASLGEVVDFTSLVDVVEAALQASGIPALHLVGHSLGGAIAAAIAARGAIDLRSLLLVAPAGLGPEINGAFVRGYLDATAEASLAPWMKELVAAPELVTPAWIRATLKPRETVVPLQRRIAAALFPDGTQAFSIRSDLASIACPTRVVVGTADRIIPSRHADGLPGLVALHRLAGVGHMPQLEARETVQAILSHTVRS